MWGGIIKETGLGGGGGERAGERGGGGRRGGGRMNTLNLSCGNIMQTL